MTIRGSKKPGVVTGHRETQRGLLYQVEYVNRDGKKARAEFYEVELSALSPQPSAGEQ